MAEHHTPPTHAEPIRWIGRDRPPLEPVPAPADRAPVPAGLAQALGIRRRWVLPAAAVVLALLIAVASWLGFSRKAAQVPLSQRQEIPLISAVTPGVRAVTSSVSFTGAVAARYDMPIGNDGDTGRILAVYVEAGDHVKQGQILAKIDDSVLVQQVNRLEASLEQARAQADLSAAEYRRAQGVEAAGALSAEDIQKRRATSVTDAAAVRVVAAQLAEARARLSRTRVVAPVEGTVLTRKAEVGQIANPGGEALFRVASGGVVEMRGQIAEQDLAQVRTGQAATVYLTGLSQAFPGTVRLLGAIIDPQTRLGDIRIALQPDPALRPGAFARAIVTTGKAQRPVVPQTAVLSDALGTYVYIVNAQNHVERRTVRVADTSDQGVVIGSGLTGTERVVTTAAGFLREGEQVKVAPATPAAP